MYFNLFINEMNIYYKQILTLINLNYKNLKLEVCIVLSRCRKEQVN